jgi:hypothetical protein
MDKTLISRHHNSKQGLDARIVSKLYSCINGQKFVYTGADRYLTNFYPHFFSFALAVLMLRN